MRLALLVLLASLSAAVVAAPERGVRALDERLDEEEDSGSWFTKILFWPEWLYQQLPLSDAAKETAHQAYLTLTNVPVIGWALIGRDSLRDTTKSADRWISGDNTTAATTTDNSTMMSAPSNVSTTTDAELFDYDFGWKDAEAEMALDFELEELRRLQEDEEEEEKTITVV